MTIVEIIDAHQGFKLVTDNITTLKPCTLLWVVKDKYGWRRFVLDGRRAFTGYFTVMSSGGWRSGFRTSGRAKGLEAVK
ncbi:hypothetical protein Hanom_Chr10g00918321 [Helianthus anomalus]